MKRARKLSWTFVLLAICSSAMAQQAAPQADPCTDAAAYHAQYGPGLEVYFFHIAWPVAVESPSCAPAARVAREELISAMLAHVEAAGCLPNSQAYREMKEMLGQSLPVDALDEVSVKGIPPRYLSDDPDFCRSPELAQFRSADPDFWRPTYE